MRVVRLKNNQDVTTIYIGQEIEPGEYYQLQTEYEIGKAASDSKVNQDIWTDPIKLIINDGVRDLDQADGDRWLKGTDTRVLVSNEIGNPYNSTLPFPVTSHLHDEVGYPYAIDNPLPVSIQGISVEALEYAHKTVLYVHSSNEAIELTTRDEWVTILNITDGPGRIEAYFIETSNGSNVEVRLIIDGIVKYSFKPNDLKTLYGAENTNLRFFDILPETHNSGKSLSHSFPKDGQYYESGFKIEARKVVPQTSSIEGYIVQRGKYI